MEFVYAAKSSWKHFGDLVSLIQSAGFQGKGLRIHDYVCDLDLSPGQAFPVGSATLNDIEFGDWFSIIGSAPFTAANHDAVRKALENCEGVSAVADMNVRWNFQEKESQQKYPYTDHISTGRFLYADANGNADSTVCVCYLAEGRRGYESQMLKDEARRLLAQRWLIENLKLPMALSAKGERGAVYTGEGDAPSGVIAEGLTLVQCCVTKHRWGEILKGALTAAQQFGSRLETIEWVINPYLTVQMRYGVRVPANSTKAEAVRRVLEFVGRSEIPAKAYRIEGSVKMSKTNALAFVQEHSGARDQTEASLFTCEVAPKCRATVGAVIGREGCWLTVTVGKPLSPEQLNEADRLLDVHLDPSPIARKGRKLVVT